MRHTITKTFEFCYGHRVWSQTLNTNYADDLKCACRHLHGHECKLDVQLTTSRLKSGMVTDFRHLEWFKKWINQYIDHRFIIDSGDPLFDHLTLGRSLTPVKHEFDWCGHPHQTTLGHEIKLLPEDVNTPIGEMLESFFVVTFVPTSENLADWILGMIHNRMRALDVVVSQVDWWETPKSRATFVNDETA